MPASGRTCRFRSLRLLGAKAVISRAGQERVLGSLLQRSLLSAFASKLRQ